MLADEGARVLTFGRHPQELEDSLANARDGGGEACGLTADSSRREDIETVFAAVDERLGGIDMLICCAALGAQPLHEMDEDAWRYVIETNLVGYMSCARQAIERMHRSGGGHLLFVGSISSTVKAPGESVYTSTKAGIDAFAETLFRITGEDPELLHEAPHSTAISRPDEVAAARNPMLCCRVD